jgi:prolyl-tRNA editing enzyme YbaK/EbsC (Cys-tRNA(Pro) deacylase)
VFAQRTLTSLEVVFVNGGSRGFLVGIDPITLVTLTGARLVDVAVPREGT